MNLGRCSPRTAHAAEQEPGSAGVHDAVGTAAGLDPGVADIFAGEIQFAVRSHMITRAQIEHERGGRFRPLAILPTMVHLRRPASGAAAALIRERFGELVLPEDIPWSARFDNAALSGVPVAAREPGTQPAKAYRAAARALLGQLGQSPAKRKGAVRDFVRRAGAHPDHRVLCERAVLAIDGRHDVQRDHRRREDACADERRGKPRPDASKRSPAHVQNVRPAVGWPLTPPESRGRGALTVLRKPFAEDVLLRWIARACGRDLPSA